MAELADAHGSGPCESNFMQVQVLLSAPESSLGLCFGSLIFAKNKEEIMILPLVCAVVICSLFFFYKKIVQYKFEMSNLYEL